MRGLKRFIYSVIGVSVFVVLPGFFIVSIHMEKNLPGNVYVVTDVSGRASIQYQVSHSIPSGLGLPAEYKKESQWITLKPGAKIGSGVRIKVDEFAYVDIMKSNEAALRIKENTLVRLDQVSTLERLDAALDYGKIICRVRGGNSSGKNRTAPKFRVITPVATANVRGTSFSVDYLKKSKITNVSVMEGRVAVESISLPRMGLTVSRGQQLCIDPSHNTPVLSNIPADLQQELRSAQNLQIETSLYQNWQNVLGLVTDSPLYHWAVAEITRYEMKVFLRAIQYFAPLRWRNDVPASLKSVELQDGDYIDPWGTEYYYEKLGRGNAMLISAGPDKTLHTADDIYMTVSLQN